MELTALRVFLAVAVLAARAHAETDVPDGIIPTIRPIQRRPMAWTHTVGAARPQRLMNRLMVGIGVGAGTTENIDQQVRFYALERVTAGGRIRVSDARVVYEAEVGWAPMQDSVRWFGTHARIDYVVLGGLGLKRDLARLPFVGSAVRVHPRTSTRGHRNALDMLAFELGVRGTYELGARADIEIMLGVSVVLPFRF